MTLEAFLRLTEEEQLQLLSQQGIYIGKRRHRKYYSLLYQLEAFYVEIVYYKYRLLVCTVRYSRSTSVLDPYLDQVKTGELVK